MHPPGFRPVTAVDGYLPLRDYGLIGDGTTAALVGRDGAIPWLCLPRFDSEPLFCAILDSRRGGRFRLAPADLREARQQYLPGTGVLVTEMRGESGLVRVTDALTLRSGADLTEDAAADREELLRSVEVLDGSPRLIVDLEPRGGADAEPGSGGLRIRCRERPDLELHLFATVPLSGLRTEVVLKPGTAVHFLMRWHGTHVRQRSPEEVLHATIDCWTRWGRHFRYEGPQREMVRRSAITLKLLDHFRNGAIVAAPTSSLPEEIGGVRNWDYRYCWSRDAALSVYALHRIGYSSEAADFLAWVLDAVERGQHVGVLYDLDGNKPPVEREDQTLEGYRRSRPVRWGNAASGQVQNDVYGELLDCAYQWAAHHGALDQSVWAALKRLVDGACRNWRKPDRGIWEVRTSDRAFTYSAAMCQVALDRGARLAERFGLPGDTAGWRREAGRIRDAILNEAWDPALNAIRQHLGAGGLDASVLSLPLRRVVPATDPRMVATVRAVTERLGAGDGLLYRYSVKESPDGLPGGEGAFLLCSFWLVDNLAGQGRLQEAIDLYDSLCGRAEAGLGLLPEEIHPGTGEFLGNFPQAFSHIGVISSGFALWRALKEARSSRK